MALPNPPNNVPQIVDVQQPSTGHYVVSVKMPTNLASKWPSKPWLTPITDIGLSAKDAALYPDYVLVDVEPMKGTPDLLWIFQKLSGPLWSTIVKSRENLIPQKFQEQVVTTTTTQEVIPSTVPADLTGDIVLNQVAQNVDTGKALQTITTEVIAEDVGPLLGQQFSPQGALMKTENLLVVEGTNATKGVNVASSVVDPLGNGKSIKQTVIANARPPTGSDVVAEGWPQMQKKSIGTESLIPQKFRRQVVSELITTQEALAQALVNDIPDPAAPTGDEGSIEHEKINDYRYEKRVSVETIAEDASPLEGEEYGDIVTKSVSEEIVPEGTAADTGLEIVSSIVDPLGNGKSVKTTKSVKGGAWPDPLNREVSKDGSYLPPQRYRKDLTRTNVSRKIAAGAIPAAPSLSGNEIAKSYKKETPDRAEETVTSETFTLNVEAVDESVEQKPFVKILSRMTPGPTSVIPAVGNASSKLVYESSATDIYENTEEIATAKPGLKGIETDAQQWGKILSTTNYTTSDVAPAGGSVRLIFDDGVVKVYEATTTEPTVGGTSIDFDPQNWGLIQWNGVYATTPSGPKSRQVWSNGEVSVFLNETPVLTISGTNKDIEAQTWGSLTWNGVYAAVSSGVKSRQVYSGPGGPVFLNETPEVEVGGTNVDLDIFAWGAVKWNGVFSDTFDENADRSKQVYRIGDITIFLNETAELIVNSVEFVSKKESNAILTETQRTSYGLSPTFEGNGSSTVVYAIREKKVYENTSITREAKAPRKYAGLTNVTLPPIWQGFHSSTIKRRDGADYTIITPFLTPGYSGPIVCEIEEFWTEDPDAGAIQPTVMLPTPIDFNSPTGSFSTAPCLHGQVSISWTTGTKHKIFEFLAETMTFNATTPPTYVGMKIVAGASSTPYLDGYVVRIYRVQL
jgi:hypothetical protein